MQGSGVQLLRGEAGRIDDAEIKRGCIFLERHRIGDDDVGGVFNLRRSIEREIIHLEIAGDGGIVRAGAEESARGRGEFGEAAERQRAAGIDRAGDIDAGAGRQCNIVLGGDEAIDGDSTRGGCAHGLALEKLAGRDGHLLVADYGALRRLRRNREIDIALCDDRALDGDGAVRDDGEGAFMAAVAEIEIAKHDADFILIDEVGDIERDLAAFDFIDDEPRAGGD